MSGALAERDFVEKLRKYGFLDVSVEHRRPWGIDDCALYPLFDAELIDLMHRVIPIGRHDHIADSIVVTARLGS